MTKIEWTDVTWNPVAGCTRVSPGCDHCYAAVVPAHGQCTRIGFAACAASASPLACRFW